MREKLYANKAKQIQHPNEMRRSINNSESIFRIVPFISAEVSITEATRKIGNAYLSGWCFGHGDQGIVNGPEDGQCCGPLEVETYQDMEHRVVGVEEVSLRSRGIRIDELHLRNGLTRKLGIIPCRYIIDTPPFVVTDTEQMKHLSGRDIIEGVYGDKGGEYIIGLMQKVEGDIGIPQTIAIERYSGWIPSDDFKIAIDEDLPLNPETFNVRESNTRV